MRIKIKDLTEKQFKDWDAKNCTITANCNECPFQYVKCDGTWLDHKDLYTDKFLNQEIEIDNKPILDKQEKEYLEAFLKPFKDKNVTIKKVCCMDSQNSAYEFLTICVDSISIYCDTEHITLPYFFSGTKYKGLDVHHKYTLKELGLFENEN